MWTEIPWSYQQRKNTAAVERDQRKTIVGDSRESAHYWCQVTTFKGEKRIVKTNQYPTMVSVLTAKFKIIKVLTALRFLTQKKERRFYETNNSSLIAQNLESQKLILNGEIVRNAKGNIRYQNIWNHLQELQLIKCKIRAKKLWGGIQTKVKFYIQQLLQRSMDWETESYWTLKLEVSTLVPIY